MMPTQTGEDADASGSKHPSSTCRKNKKTNRGQERQQCPASSFSEHTFFRVSPVYARFDGIVHSDNNCLSPDLHNPQMLKIKSPQFKEMDSWQSGIGRGRWVVCREVFELGKAGFEVGLVGESWRTRLAG